MVCEGREFVLDASVVITFSRNGEFGLLEDILQGRAIISDEVYEECVSPRTSLDAAIARGMIQRSTISTPGDLAYFASARGQMDVGEASAIALAHARGATVLCDDDEARRVGRSLPDAPVVEGTLELLGFAVAHGRLSAEQAEVHVATFIAGGAYLPGVPEGYFDSLQP